MNRNNRKTTALVLASWNLGLASVMSQGSFQNLDFESARLPPLSVEDRAIWTNASAAVPYWSVFYGTQPAQEVLYHGLSLGSTLLSVVDPNMLNPSERAISGNFSVALAAGVLDVPTDLTLAQSGTIPANAQSFRFKVRGTIPDGWLEVYFQNQFLPIQQLESLGGINIYGADITAFASRYGELKLVAVAPRPFGLRGKIIDDLEFSPMAVPETSAFVLFALGSGLAGWWWRRRSKGAEML